MREITMVEATAPQLILHNGRITTLNRSLPTATAVAVTDGCFSHVGQDSEILALAGGATRVIDLARHHVLPGLVDSHIHIVRGGLSFNLELRWEGVRSLADAMA